MPSPATRTRTDRCPGVLRPWPADDGQLVRIRLAGGELTTTQLVALVSASERFGDGQVHPTCRANLQLRGFPGDGDGHLAPEAEQAIRATGLVPSPDHDLVRNIMASPLTGISGGRADLSPMVAALDAGLCADAALADLPGKFLFVLDDGRGDLIAHDCDLGLVALDAHRAQVRIGDGWGEVIALTDAAPTLLALARQFLASRGDGPTSAWHVAELATPLVTAHEPDPGLPASSDPLPFGDGDGWRHVELGPDGIDGSALLQLVEDADRVRITPWYGVLVAGRR